MPSPFTCVLDAKADLGECPVWSVKEQALYWVDINAPSLNRFDPATGRNVAMPMPEAIGCFALRRAGGFVVALRGGVWLADADGTLGRKVAGAPVRSGASPLQRRSLRRGRALFRRLDERETRREFRDADSRRS